MASPALHLSTITIQQFVSVIEKAGVLNLREIYLQKNNL